MPAFEPVAELPSRIGAAEIIDPDHIDWLVLGGGQGAERFAEGSREALFDALVVVVDKAAEPSKILAPVVVRVGHILIAFLVPATDDIEVGEVARVRPHGNSDNREGRTGEENTQRPVSGGVFALAFQDIEDGFGDENIEEGKNREEVAEADVQVAGDADIAIEKDEEDHQILGDPFAE